MLGINEACSDIIRGARFLPERRSVGQRKLEERGFDDGKMRKRAAIITAYCTNPTDY